MAIYPGQDAWNADEYCFEVCEAWICQHGIANFEAERRWLKSVIDLYLLHNESDRNRVQLERVWAGGMPRRDWVSGQFVDGELNSGNGQTYQFRAPVNRRRWYRNDEWQGEGLLVRRLDKQFALWPRSYFNFCWPNTVVFPRRRYHSFILRTGDIESRLGGLLNIWPTNFNSVTSLARGR